MAELIILQKARRWTFAERIEKMERIGDAWTERGWGWVLSPRFFGNVGANINDFMADDYIYFLDNVASLPDLLDGLSELSPFADDALDAAETLTAKDFADFKIAVACEHGTRGAITGKSKFPDKFLPILIPLYFIKGALLAKQFETPLGAVLIQMAEFKVDPLFSA